jgi:hypothetical protein
VEVADDERTLRRARRFIWAFRLIFYGGAAIIALLLLTGGSDANEPLIGKTGQGREFAMQFDGDRPMWFETSIRGRCPRGDGAMHHWASTQRLEVRDGVIWAETTKPSRWSTGTGELTMRLRARVDDDAVTGTLWLTNRIGSYVCAGETDFSAD